MGMGKTIQTIAAILDNRPKLQHSMPGAKHPIGEKELRQQEEERWSKHHLEWKHEMEMNERF
jgi:SNF2 family DNA or RNA helicase